MAQVHDIEDLAEYGKEMTACPYYLARKMSETSELVFCPYNYVIDPAIRAATSLEIKGSVVIFDEGHNIEDVAREAGSIDVRWQMLQDAFMDTKMRLDKDDGDGSPHHGNFLQIQAALSRIRAWLESYCQEICQGRPVDNVEPDRYQRVWNGSQVRFSGFSKAVSVN